MIRTLSIACAALLVGALATTSLAQEGESLQAKYDKKVAQSWFTDNGFTDDYDVARQKAKETGRPIFAYFTRSYSP